MPSGLTDNINAQNVVNRFADYVRGAANSGIVWGTNSLPFQEFTQNISIFGGTTAGKNIEISGGNINSNNISAQVVYNALIEETRRYTRIRNLQAVLNVLGGGGNTGSRPTPGVVYNQTNVAHLNANYMAGSLSAGRDDVFAGNVMRRQGTANMFSNMRAAYQAVRGQAIYSQVDVCHASCHSNCHNSRGRR
jgi:hypothetical protein